ncbi:MAG: hypothetical protein WCI31_11375 [Prolixibacteraceae bacterium]
MDSDSLHNFTFDELVGVNAECHLSYFKPGESYHYSNTGYSILGKIIEGNGVLLPFWINQVLLLPPAGSSPAGWYGCGIFYSMNLG